MRKLMNIKHLMTMAVFSGTLLTGYAQCTVNIPAICRFPTTNLLSSPPYPFGSYAQTTTGYDIQCVTTNANGNFNCVSTTNNCIFSESYYYAWGSVLGGPWSRTNLWVTTTSTGSGCITNKPPG